MVAFSHCNVSFREGNSSVDLFFDSTYMSFFEIDCTRVKRTGTLFLSFLSFPAFDACSKNQHSPTYLYSTEWCSLVMLARVHSLG